ncbi:MAG: hypothetical protein ACSHX8_15460 [Opitutaceae bacterium]
MKKITIIFWSIFFLSFFASAEEIDFESRTYRVIHASGHFGTYGAINLGDTFIFNPKKLMHSKPSVVYFSEDRVVEGQPNMAYLSLVEGSFKLENRYINKYVNSECYMFLSEDRMMKVRFDVNFDRYMFINVEFNGIISGMVALVNVVEAGEQEAAGERK